MLLNCQTEDVPNPHLIVPLASNRDEQGRKGREQARLDQIFSPYDRLNLRMSYSHVNTAVYSATVLCSRMDCMCYHGPKRW